MLLLVPWLTDFAAFLLVFVVSREMAEHGASMSVLGAAGGGLSLAIALSSLAFGGLSDRAGRRRLIVAGLAVMLAGIGACGVLDPTDVVLFLAAYWATGLGLGLAYPPLIAWLSQGRGIAGGKSPISQVLIRFCLSWNLGIICGQLCGGWLFTLGRQWPILIGMVLVVCDLGIVLAAGRRAAQPASAPLAWDYPQSTTRSLSSAFAKLGWISNLGGAFAISMVFHLFPKLAVDLGIPSHRHGTMLVMVRLIAILMYFVMYHTRFWHHRLSTALGAQALAILGLIALARASSEMGLVAGLAAVGLLVGYNYFASIYYSTTSAHDNRRGAASGIHEATLGLGFAAGSFLGGGLGDIAGARAPYLLAVGVILLLAAIQIRVYIRDVGPAVRRVWSEIRDMNEVSHRRPACKAQS